MHRSAQSARSLHAVCTQSARAPQSTPIRAHLAAPCCPTLVAGVLRVAFRLSDLLHKLRRRPRSIKILFFYTQRLGSRLITNTMLAGNLPDVPRINDVTRGRRCSRCSAGWSAAGRPRSCRRSLRRSATARSAHALGLHSPARRSRRAFARAAAARVPPHRHAPRRAASTASARLRVGDEADAAGGERGFQRVGQGGAAQGGRAALPAARVRGEPARRLELRADHGSARSPTERRRLTELDLSDNPICGVEEGGADDYSPGARGDAGAARRAAAARKRIATEWRRRRCRRRRRRGRAGWAEAPPTRRASRPTLRTFEAVNGPSTGRSTRLARAAG